MSEKHIQDLSADAFEPVLLRDFLNYECILSEKLQIGSSLKFQHGRFLRCFLSSLYSVCAT